MQCGDRAKAIALFTRFTRQEKGYDYFSPSILPAASEQYDGREEVMLMSHGTLGVLLALWAFLAKNPGGPLSLKRRVFGLAWYAAKLAGIFDRSNGRWVL